MKEMVQSPILVKHTPTKNTTKSKNSINPQYEYFHISTVKISGEFDSEIWNVFRGILLGGESDCEELVGVTHRR